ncbi:hypothetical protein FBEOM_9890 [Fusarium beomiforme]|uniref:Uncharacterized protein n=1 Tax=Fusarium beomiforme TaxID=44412 RepID=A0A9P5ACI4_9HYPO|nr:hypothetical protein FBEOM_9890 [Fusarium beomiforme]
MRLDLFLLVALAGPSSAVPCGMKSYHSFRRSWSSASTRLNSVLSDLPIIYRGGGTVPPGAVAYTTSTVMVSAASFSGNDALATSTASTGLVASSTSTSISTAIATVTANASVTPTASSSGELDSGKSPVSAAPSAINPRATTTTTTTTTRPASISATDPSFTTEGHHGHETDHSDHEPGTFAHAKDTDTISLDSDSHDHDFDIIRKSKLLPRRGEEKRGKWSLKDREDAVEYLKEHSKKLWKAANQMLKLLNNRIKSCEKAEKKLKDKQVALTSASLKTKQAYTYARTQQKYLSDAQNELERAQREKSAKDVQNLSPEKILCKEDFAKYASSHRQSKRSKVKVHSKPKDPHDKGDEVKKHKHEIYEDKHKHNKGGKKTEEEALREYEDKLYGKIEDQLKEKLGKTSPQKDSQKDHETHAKTVEKPLYLVTKQIKVYKCTEEEDCKYKYDPKYKEEKVEKVEAKEHGEKKDEKTKHHKEERVEEAAKGEAKKEKEIMKVKEEKERNKDAENEENETPLLAGGNEAEQLKRLSELYMQYRPMLVKPIRKDLDPILKNDQYAEDTEMAEKHKEGDEKEQRKRLSRLYMGYRYMLTPKFQKQLDPILHADYQKAN